MGLSDCRLRWPRECRACAAPSHRSFGPVRALKRVGARATSTVVPAMLSVASARSKERVRTEPKSSAIIGATGEKCGLGGYVHDGRQLPQPSRAYGATVVELSVITTAKLALYQAMQDEHVSLTTLASRVGVTETTVSRLLDLDCRSHIDQVATALMALGRH